MELEEACRLSELEVPTRKSCSLKVLDMDCNIENWNLLLERIQYLKEEVKKYKYDYLTGLRMRKDFDSGMHHLFERFEFEDKPFVLIIVDIDGLHALNRELGFAAGDELIRNVSESLKQVFIECKSAEIFRIGGDEFGVLLPDFNIPELEKRLDSIDSTTWAYTICDDKLPHYLSPNKLFKMTDEIIVQKKASRPKATR